MQFFDTFAENLTTVYENQGRIQEAGGFSCAPVKYGIFSALYAEIRGDERVVFRPFSRDKADSLLQIAVFVTEF